MAFLIIVMRDVGYAIAPDNADPLTKSMQILLPKEVVQKENMVSKHSYIR